MKFVIKNKIKLSKNLYLSNKNKCFIVAEISANHSGNLNLLKKTMLKAKSSGANAVKIQSYQAETMTLNVKNKHFLIDDNSIWKGRHLFSLYKKAETPFKWHNSIFKFAKKNKILCFSAPFDESAVDLLEKFNCPIYKIASPEIEDLRLIKKIAKLNKPMIISTGIADESNLKDVLAICRKYRNNKLIFLNCISSYPAKNSELNINYINVLKKYSPIVGYSDHSNSELASLASISLGAKIIEKHFILSKNIKSPDKTFSSDPKEFKSLVKKIRLMEEMLGKENINKKKLLKGKLKTITRSIFYSKSIKKGGKITIDNIKSVRPGTGLKLGYFDKILGKTLNKNVKFGNPVKISDFKI